MVYPFSIREFWENCIYSFLAHAIFTARYPILSYEQSWDGNNYSMQDSQGTRGTVSFDNSFLVSALRDDRYIQQSYIDPISYINDAPDPIRRRACDDTLQYLLVDIDGIAKPVITTAFWGIDNALYSHHSFAEFLQLGGHLFQAYLRPLHDAKRMCHHHFEFAASEITLLDSLFDRYLADPHGTTLSEQDLLQLNPDDEESLSESLQSFAEIGIGISP